MKTTQWWREPTRGQWLSFGAAWSGWVLDAFDFTIFMLVMPQIAREFGVPNLATTGSIALTLVARLAGGFIAGAMADRWGRKLPLLISIVWFALCDGAVAFAPSFTWILVLRTLFGIGMGAEWTSGTTLAMENWPTRSRGIASGILQGSWAIGYLAAAIVSSVVLPIWGWRGLFVIAALPALLVLPMRAWIPESLDAKRSGENAAPLRALFAPEILRKLVWASAAMALGLGAYYALTGLYPTMLATELAQSAGSIAWLVALFNIGMLIGSIAFGTIASRYGATVAIVVPALASLAAIPLYVGAQPSLLPVGAFAGGALGVGFCGVVPLLLTGLVGPEVRARFVGVVYHVGALFAALVPMAIAALAEYGGLSLAASIGVGVAVCEAALAILVLARRTSFGGARTRTAVAVTAVLAIVACSDAPIDPESTSRTSAALDTVTGFGSNPANLTMYRYAPAGMPPNAPVVVALHGCTQTALALSNIGLDALADQFKFYVIYPQQNSANNPVSCFDWWGAYNNPVDKTNITRGQGENLSIKQMVDKTIADYSVDRSRVYIIGFSAGGATAAVMLAAWPDVFAAGAIDAGIPYNCPSTTNSDVFTCMSPGKTLAASDWGTKVKSAYSGYSGAYPRVSIWQGTSDNTVAYANSAELTKQWTNVHGLTTTPSQSDMVNGYPHATYADANNVVQVETYAITGMDHGVAVDPSHGCGTAGQYIIDKGICSVRHMIDFFGITGATPHDGGVTSDGSAGDGGGSGDGGAHDASTHAPDSGSHGDGGHVGDGGSTGPASADDGGGFGDMHPAANDASFAGCAIGAPRSRSSNVASFALALLALAFFVRRRAS